MAEQFGKYQLIRRIGSGGMAEVFLARTAVAQGLAKELVIKKIHPAYARSRHFVGMFVAEAKIALGLNHPNIVQVFDFGTVGGTFFLAMEYVDGCDLLYLVKEAVHRQQPVPLGLCAHIVREVAKALDYAHRKTDEFGEPLGIVHRDVSLQNVLVSWDGAVKLVDFGIARARGVHENEGVVKGKYAYMSPEQARGDAVDLRSDIYSAGVVLFELCCGEPLFPGRGREILAQVKAGAVPRPRDINPDIPDALEHIILRALCFNRDDRYATARDLHTALGQFQLEQAKSGSDIIDSEALARFMVEIFGPERRSPSSLPAEAVGAGRDSAGSEHTHSTGDLTTGTSSFAHLDSMATHSVSARAPLVRHGVRERKYVLVVASRVCGLPTSPTRVGAPLA
ncbi:MAG: serine/threonine-protein kinase, partial [Myxococcota bacterium]